MARLILISVILAGCSITPREGKTPEVKIHIAEAICDHVKVRDVRRGVMFVCTTNF